MIIVAVVVLGALSVGGYFYIKESTAVKVQERIQRICTLEEISKIEFKKDELVTIQKEGNIWRNLEWDYLEYDSALVSEWIQFLQTAETIKIVKNVEDESVYGINEHSTIITVYDSVNNSETLRIGNINKEEDYVYIKNDQDEVIYMVSYEVGQKLLTKPSTFVKYEDELKIGTIHKLQLQYPNQEPMKITFNENWYLENYYKIPCQLKEEAVEALNESIGQLKLTAYVGTYEELSAFGLEEPQLELSINENITLSFGNIKGKGVYVKLGEGKDVYTVDQSVYAQIETFKPFDAIKKQLTYLSLDQIEAILLTNPQGTYEWLLDGNKQTDSQDQEIETITQESPMDEQQNEQKETEKLEQFVWLNEHLLSKEEAQEWLDTIQTSLHIEALLQNPQIEQKEERKAEASIEYRLKDGSAIQIELIPYDINYYILRYNGDVQFAVNKDKVTKLFMQLNSFVKGK